MYKTFVVQLYHMYTKSLALRKKQNTLLLSAVVVKIEEADKTMSFLRLREIN